MEKARVAYYCGYRGTSGNGEIVKESVRDRKNLQEINKIGACAWESANGGLRGNRGREFWIVLECFVEMVGIKTASNL
jgi:hypothetical protein